MKTKRVCWIGIYAMLVISLAIISCGGGGGGSSGEVAVPSALKTILLECVGELPNRTMVVPIDPHAMELAVEEAGTELPWTVNPGLTTVGTNTPVLIQSGSTTGPYSWIITDSPYGFTPPVIHDADTRCPYFTPFAIGAYVLEDGAGGMITITANRYAGRNDLADGTDFDSNCFCHGIQPEYRDSFLDWRDTGHAEIFTEEIDLTAALGGHYSSGCFPCHTVGSDGYDDNGFTDQAKYDAFYAEFWPAGDLIAVSSTLTSYAYLEANYPALYKRGNIQCENCHGPHGATGGGEVSLASDVCAVCHGEPTRHGRFQQWQVSGHANMELAIDEATCTPCHSALGFISYVNGVSVTDTELEANPLPQTCVVCHDPHNVGTTTSAGTDAQMRGTFDVSVGTAAGFTVNGAGKAGICMVCHNSRRAGIPGSAGNPYSDGRAPHGGTETDVLRGENAAIFGGVPSPGVHADLDDPCVQCHMRQIDNLEFGRAGQTNHTWDISAYICDNCHSDESSSMIVVGDLEVELGNQLADTWEASLNNALASTNISFEADTVITIPMGTTGDPIDVVLFYDYHGRQAIDFAYAGTTYEGIQLRNLYVGADDVAQIAEDGNTGVQDLLGAGWDLLIIENDGSTGAHNPVHSENVLIANIAAMASSVTLP